MNRRSLFSLPLAGLVPSFASAQTAARRGFRISLAEWSLHRAIQSRMITNLEFPRIAREQFGIEGLEFVNTLWEPPTQYYMNRLKRAIKDSGTTPVLIMVDGEGNMGSPSKEERMKAPELHYKWIDAAAELGCHSIRSNMYPGEKQPSTPAEIETFLNHCTESFNKLLDYAQPRNINVIIENHGGISSNPDVVVALMKKVNRPNFGTLPDFGNFPPPVDRYDAVAKLMRYAKGASFKCHDFKDGKETRTDMDRMMGIVKATQGFDGWVGIEYEGSRLTEFEGIQAAKMFLDRWNAAQG